MPHYGAIRDWKTMFDVLDEKEDAVNIAKEKAIDKFHEITLEDLPETAWHGPTRKEELIKYRNEAKASMIRKHNDILLGKIAAPVFYDDGDQSPVTDSYGQMLLRIEWSQYFNQVNPIISPWLSDWSLVLFCGEYQGMLEILSNKTEEEIKMLLKKRESYANLGSVYFVVIGASRVMSEYIVDHMENYKKCLLHLIKLGAEVTVRDIAGFTPLHHCAGPDANDITLELAQILIKAGADVNVRNRSGETPLKQATEIYKYDVIQLLLDHGADPYIGEYSKNLTPIEMVKDFPKIRKMFNKVVKKQQKDERDKIKESVGINNCNVCNKQENGNKRCSGCYMVFYCDRKCQVKDWDNHKVNCKQIQKEYKMCFLSYNPEHPSGVALAYDPNDPQIQYDNMFLHRLMLNLNHGLKKLHFVVKVIIQFYDEC